MIWQEAMEKWADLEDEKEGFYLSNQVRNGNYTAILAIAIESRQTSVLLGTATKKLKNDKKKDQMFQIYRPNTGLQVRLESLADLEKKYKKVDSSAADKHWIKQYDASVNTCSHAFWSGTCRHVTMGFECEVRRETSIGNSILIPFTSGRTASPNVFDPLRFRAVGLGPRGEHSVALRRFGAQQDASDSAEDAGGQEAGRHRHMSPDAEKVEEIK